MPAALAAEPRTHYDTYMPAARYSGTVTTSGNSEAIRLENALCRVHPEFHQGSRVTATVIAPGQMLVSVCDEGAPGAEADPILDAFLGFIADDMAHHPEHLRPLSASAVAEAVELTSGLDAGDDDTRPSNRG